MIKQIFLKIKILLGVVFIGFNLACYGSEDNIIYDDNVNVDNANENFIVTLKVNYEPTEHVVTVMQNSSKELLVLLEDLKQFYVKESYLRTALVTINYAEYVNLNRLYSTNSHLDGLNLVLDIRFPASEMLPQYFNGREVAEKEEIVGNPASGAFLNYELTFTNSNSSKYVAGFQELSYFNDSGVLSNTFLVKEEQKKSTTSLNNKTKLSSQIVRFDSSWTTDKISDMARWRVGDSNTKAANWSSSTRFGGIQYATNFAVRPDLVTHPLMAFKGRAELPTTLDIYANSIPVYHTKLRSGDFDINNLPVNNGKGDLIVRTEDITGKIETLKLPYYSVPSLLTKGLSDFSFAAGFQRLNYGVQDFDYSSLLINADYMHGISDVWTSGGHFDMLRNFASVGATNIFKLGNYGSIAASLVTNLTRFNQAQKLTIGYSYQSENYNFNANIANNGKRFYDTYNPQAAISAKPTIQTSIGYNNQRFGGISISYLSFVSSSIDGAKQMKMLTSSYDKDITKNSGLRLSAGTDLNNKKKNIFFVASFRINISNDKSVLVNRAKQKNITTTQYTISSPIGAPIGWGYNASLITKGKTKEYDIQVDKNTEHLDSSLFLFNSDRVKTQQLSLKGAVVAIDKSLFFTQTVSNGMALVKVANLKNIPVYYNNQIVGDTDSKGKLLIPDVIPYVPSEISLDQQKLPLDTEFSSLTVKTVTKPKSAVVINYEIVKARSAEMILVNEYRQPLPFDHTVTIEGIDDDLFVGYNGQLFVNDMKDLNILKGKVCDEDKCCAFETPINQNSQDPIIDLGEIICK